MTKLPLISPQYAADQAIFSQRNLIDTAITKNDMRGAMRRDNSVRTIMPEIVQTPMFNSVNAFQADQEMFNQGHNTDVVAFPKNSK